MKILKFTDDVDKINIEKNEILSGNVVRSVNYTTKEIVVLDGEDAVKHKKRQAHTELEKFDSFVMKLIFELIGILIQKGIIELNDFSPMVRDKYNRIKDLNAIIGA